MTRWFKNRRGSMLLFGAMFIFALALFGTFLVEWGRLYTIRSIVEGSLQRALYAATLHVDRVRYAEGEIYILEPEAEQAFRDILRIDLGLDSTYHPTPQSPPFTGPVRIIDFRVYNSDNPGFPTRTPEDWIVDRPSVYARIEVDVRPILFEYLRRDVTIPVALLVGANCPPGAYCDQTN